jgi:hypothetical protein
MPAIFGDFFSAIIVIEAMRILPDMKFYHRSHYKTGINISLQSISQMSFLTFMDYGARSSWCGHYISGCSARDQAGIAIRNAEYHFKIPSTSDQFHHKAIAEVFCIY